MEKSKKTRIEQKQERMQELKQFDNSFRNQYKYIIGIDEAGRGPLAGPVVVAGVIFDENIEILGIDDSKKISEKRREELYEEILQKALAYKIVEVDAEKIDEINILEATKYGVCQIVNNINIKPDLVLVDALKDLNITEKYISVIKGDATSYSIAAASILAKVYRDRKMKEIAKIYPEYEFEKHKGYGTKLHYEKLKMYGLSDIHRKSFIHLDEQGNRIKL